MNSVETQITLGFWILIAGHPRFRAEPGADIKGCFYSSTGHTLGCVYEIERDKLTIWFEERVSRVL